MPEHQLPAGKRWIENLLRLGGALGYEPEPEFDVSPADSEEEAPVDVAWLGEADEPAPLFIIEVESTPGTQIANNAGKVFGQDSRLFEKPLFHFHIVLSGGQTSFRVDTAHNLFGAFNYRLYRVAVAHEATDAICDMLSQHRRVTRHVDVLALAGALDPGTWSELDLDVVWRHAEECRFSADWETDYAQLARSDEAFLPRLLDLIARRLGDMDSHPGGYPSFIGATCPGLLEAALLCGERPHEKDRCLGHVRAWQDSHDLGKVLAPRYGLSEDHDNLIYALAPAVWAVLAAAFGDHVEGRRWVLEEMLPVIEERSWESGALTAIWMLHIAASPGEEHVEYFDKARAALNQGGGISAELLAEPPVQGGYAEEYDAWYELLNEDTELVPDLVGFRDRFARDPAADVRVSSIALDYLLDELPPDCGDDLVALLNARKT